jgi:metal-responsive CopG/Arc/MetJ family transcriptional regulator
MGEVERVDIQVRNVPKQLLGDFDRIVVKPFYPGGRSAAIRDLIDKAVKAKKLEASE